MWLVVVLFANLLDGRVKVKEIHHQYKFVKYVTIRFKIIKNNHRS